MQLRKGLRGVAAAALSAATLLSLGIAGVANADTNVDLRGVRGTITFTNAQAGHTLEFIQLAEYQAAQAVSPASNSRLSNVAYTTTTNSTVRPLVQAAADAAHGSPVSGDPMNWVGANLDSSNAAPYAGSLRNFVTTLTSGSNFGTLIRESSKTINSTAPAGDGKFTQGNLIPGVYLVLDTTGYRGGHSPVASAAIPMLVSTTIGDHETIGTTNPGTPLGVVHMKNDDRKLTKRLTKVNNVDVVAGQQFNVGDKLTYVLTTKAPNLVGYQTPYYFHIQDYPSDGLDYVSGSSSVKVGSTSLRVTPTIGRSSVKYINWDLSNEIDQNMYGQDIVITYDVEIREGGTQKNSASMFTPTSPSVTPPAPDTIPGGPGAPGPGVDETPADPAPPVDPNIPTNPEINPFGVEFKHFVKNVSPMQFVSGAEYKVYNITNGNNNLLSFKKNGTEYVNWTSVPPARDTNPVITVPSGGVLSVKGLSAGKYKFDMVTPSTNSPFPLRHTFEVTISNDGDFKNTADIWNLVEKDTIRPDSARRIGQLDVPDAATATQLPITGGAGIILVVALAVLAGSAVVVTSVMRRRALMTAKK